MRVHWCGPVLTRPQARPTLSTPSSPKRVMRAAPRGRCKYLEHARARQNRESGRFEKAVTEGLEGVSGA